MADARSGAAEIVRSFDQSPAEVMLPNPVHDYAGGQGVVLPRNPFGEGQSQACAALVLGRTGLQLFVAEYFGQTRRHLFTRGSGVAAEQ